jgi:hypothetical protein
VIDAATIHTATYRAVPTDRSYHAGEVVSATVNAATLDPRTEAEVRAEMHAQIASLIELSDAVVAAEELLRATGDRLDRHVRTHDICRIGVVQGCWAWRDLQKTYATRRRDADRAWDAYRRGRR